MRTVYVVMHIDDINNSVIPPNAYSSEAEAIAAFVRGLNAILPDHYMLMTATCSSENTLEGFALQSGTSYSQIMAQRAMAQLPPQAVAHLRHQQPASAAQRPSVENLLNFMGIPNANRNREIQTWSRSLVQFLPADFFLSNPKINVLKLCAYVKTEIFLN